MSSSHGENGNDSNRDERTDSEPPLEGPAKDQAAKRVKRKKASRACFHCQKAHLTCDDSRPCQRCIKRGLDESCQDGVRKRAKYLQDIDNGKLWIAHQQRTEREESLLSESKDSTTTPQTTHISSIDTPVGTVNLAAVSRPTNGENLLFDYPPLSSYDFDSKAANLEYSMLSTMLGNIATPGTDQATSPDHFTFPSPSANGGGDRGMPSRQQTLTPDLHSVHSDASSWTQLPFAGAPAPINIPRPRTTSLALNSHSPAQTLAQHSQNGGHIQSLLIDPPSPSVTNRQQTQRAPAQSLPAHLSAPMVASAQNHTDPHGQRPTPVARRPFTPNPVEPNSVYKSITKPFSYTNGYHLLNNYLRSRFAKDDLLRIARAIVGYRPSFIALTKTLREEDLTFMEVCFQRTLLEYEKFVGYSGTPTIIWRRTGQIELVGKEFCLLTQWSRERLLSKQTFIVELMDDSSVVEYFEKFSAHAFGDTSSVQTTCVLMTPGKRAVPCAFCFTIKRDVFDIPMMIVGNFLPVL